MIAGIVNTQAHQQHQKGKHYARELCVFTYCMRAIEGHAGRENAGKQVCLLQKVQKAQAVFKVRRRYEKFSGFKIKRSSCENG